MIELINMGFEILLLPAFLAGYVVVVWIAFYCCTRWLFMDFPFYADAAIKAAIKAAVKAEREACAKVCDEQGGKKRFVSSYEEGFMDGADACAQKIRARGEK